MTPRLVVDEYGFNWLAGIIPGIWILVPGT